MSAQGRPKRELPRSAPSAEGSPVSFTAPPSRQRNWDARAAANFVCGGAGGGLIVFAVVAGVSSLALALLMSVVFGWPPPQSPPISTLPPPRRPDASIFALASLMCSPLTTTVPPVVPRCLPAAEIVPASLMVCAGAPAGLLPPVAALSTIRPLRWPIESARMTPLVLMTESTTARAAAAVSSTRPPFALMVPFLVLLTSDLSGLPVATSITLDAILSPTASVISLSPYMSSVKLLPDASATVPSVAVMVPELRTPGATSAAKPPLVAVIRP